MEKEDMLRYAESIANVSKVHYVNIRRDLLHLIDGEVFYELKKWPKSYRRIFWKKPLSDMDTFKLYLFLHGNGCPPDIMERWIISAIANGNDKQRKKRVYHLKYIKEHIEKEEKRNVWFYFDIHINMFVYLNGRKRNTARL